MATVPAIAMGVRGIELRDPLTQYSRVAAIQHAQQQNQLARMQLEQSERDNQLRNQLRAFVPTMTPENRNQLLGYGAEGRAVYESLLKGEKDQREAEKSQRETEKAQEEIAAKRLKLARDLLPAVTTPEQYAEWYQYTTTQLPGLAKMIPQQFSPDVKQMLMMEADKALEQHFVNQNLGSSTRVVAAPKYGQGPARVVEGTEARVTMAPGEAERIANERTRIGLDSARLGLEGRRVDALERKAMEGTPQGAQLSKKEVQAREASFPKATTALKGFEADADELISDLERLKNHPGLWNITGVIAGRTPSLSADGRAAQALYDKIIAKGGFQSLQDIRNASPTGGALGSISNQEGQQLKASFSEIDQKMDAEDVVAAIDRTIQKVRGSKERVREGYDLTYEYRAPSETMPAAPKPGKSNLAPQDQAALDWANANPSDPRAAKIKATLGVK